MKKVYGWIIFVVTFMILYFTLKDDYVEILNLLSKANILWLVIGFLFTMGYCYYKSMIMYNIVNQMKKFSIFKCYKIQLMTFFFNAVTPFSTGGQPFQIYKLNKEGLSLNNATSTIVKETIINQIAIIVIVLILAITNIVFKIYPMNFMLTLFLTIGILVNGLILFLVILFSHNEKAINKLLKIMNNFQFKITKIEKLEKWNNSFKSFKANSKSLFENKLYLTKLICLNMLAYFIIYIVPLTVLFSFNDFSSFNAITSIVLVSFVSIIGSFVPLPGGTGGQEYTFILLFSAYITNPLLSSVMLLWRFITYYIPMIIGGVIFNFRGGKKCA